MTRNEILNEVKIIVQKTFETEVDITEVTSLRNDLDADSLDLVELVIALEERFLGEISDEEGSKLDTIGDIVSFIEARLA